MYIARALLEGSLHIGKASPQFAGAVIGFAGKEHIIANYEVLVCASQLRWGFSPPVDAENVLTQGTVVLAQQRARSTYRSKEVDVFNTTLVESDIPRYLPDIFDVLSDREAGLRRLAEIKTIIVVDDSMSMQEGSLWEQAREALAGIVDIANQYGSKGSDIHFMHQDDYAPSMQSKAEVIALFNRVLPEGEDTPTGAKLGQIIDHYLPLIEQERCTHEPITVLVITDGLPTDQAELERVIVDAAHRLDRRRIKHDMFGIQFVQIGTDPAASELLHTLDDHLVTRYKIRDLVDSTPFDPAQGAFDTEYMLKILLGGVNKDLDRAGPNSGQQTLLSPVGPSPRPYDSRGLTGRLGISSPRLSPRPGY
jgi:Mg-chelatase subunit ChlD